MIFIPLMMSFKSCDIIYMLNFFKQGMGLNSVVNVIFLTANFLRLRIFLNKLFCGFNSDIFLQSLRFLIKYVEL